MEGRAAELVRALGLEPHPEGGHFRQTFRSAIPVDAPAGRSRPALTHIWFLLAAGERSRWHRLASDEIWHFHEGWPLDLLTVAPGSGALVRRRLGVDGPAAASALAVPAGSWQAARPLGAYALVSCVVAPGFDYADFELLADRPAERERLERAGVELGDLA
ncbi:MAG TPA: cupin domain-containing protein [Vicinamibacteria bacterium]|nr:cupin domain-containing protein [Vicinamibacteria bacterium]